MDEGSLREEAQRATRRAAQGGVGASATSKRRSARELALADEAARAVGARAAGRFRERLVAADAAFEREHYAEVRKLLAPVVAELPDLAIARELLGLSYYRLGRWRQAAGELEGHRTLSGEARHLPILADCYRALKRYRRVEEIWLELRQASPSAALVAEGRIVYAGSLADRGQLREALAALAGGETVPRKVREHDVRMWYVLGDLYDRSGDMTRARALFQRVDQHSPGYADVRERLHTLGR